MNRSLVTALALIAGAAAATGCDAFGGPKGVVAQAAGHRLTTEEAAQLLAAAPAENIPATPEIAARLAGVWADYTLLAVELAASDSLAGLPLDRILERELNQELLWRLREKEIVPHIGVTDEILRAAYDSAKPGARFHAAHILFRLPPEPEKQDSVRQLAESVRARVAAGADFAALARRYSMDDRNREKGGDLGWFEEGQMISEFQAAVAALEPGQVSPVVSSRAGFHIIKLHGRQQPPFEEIAERFRTEVEQQRAQALEQAFIDSVMQQAEVRVADGAVETVRAIVRAGTVTELSRSRARETLAEYRGGSLTAGEFFGILTQLPPQNVAVLAQGSDDQIKNALERLVQDELLLRAASDRGLTVEPAIEDSLRKLTRQRVLALAQSAGLQHEALAGADTQVAQAVKDLLTEALQGRRRIGALGVVGLALRDRHPVRIYEERLPDVAERLRQLRGADNAAPAMPPPAPAPAPSGDTAAGPS